MSLATMLREFENGSQEWCKEMPVLNKRRGMKGP